MMQPYPYNQMAYPQQPQGITPSYAGVNIQVFSNTTMPNPAQSVQNPIYNYPQGSMYANQCPNPYGYLPQAPAYPALPPAPSYPALPPKQEQMQTDSDYGKVVETLLKENEQLKAQINNQASISNPHANPSLPVIDVEPGELRPVSQPAEMPTPAVVAVPVQPTVQQTPQAAPVQQQEVQPNAAQPAPAPQPEQQKAEVNNLLNGLLSNDEKVQEASLQGVKNMIHDGYTSSMVLDGINNMINSKDRAAQEAGITLVAILANSPDPMEQATILSDSVMNSLTNVVTEDTSNMPEPTEAEINAINKRRALMQLTPEEQALVDNPSPKVLADRNKSIALYGLAMLNKNQRDEIDKYNMTQDPANQITQIPAYDLAGFSAIEAAARNNANPEVQLAGVEALSYMARPEDVFAIEPILTAAYKSSNDEVVKAVASDTLANLGVQMQDASAKDPKKMTRAEKKEAKRAAKQAEKQANKDAKKAGKAA